MKAVLISIQPKWCVKIANGEKSIEVRKTRPRLETPFKCYIYCTAGAPWLVYGDRFDGGSFCPEYATTYGWSKKEADEIWGVMNGNVIGEFVCDKIFDICIKISKLENLLGYPFPGTGLTDMEILQYLKNGSTGYGLHISDLVIYDEPKPLRKFTKPYGTIIKAFDSPYIQRPPQSWCYVEEEKQ